MGARKNMSAKGSQQRTNVPTMTAIIRVILYIQGNPDYGRTFF